MKHFSWPKSKNTALPTTKYMCDTVLDGYFNLLKHKAEDKMSEELTIKKDRVLEAAKSCPDVKAVLEKLWPEVFKEKVRKEISLQDLEIASLPYATGLVVKEKGEGAWMFRLVRPRNYVASDIGLTTRKTVDGDVVMAIYRK